MSESTTKTSFFGVVFQLQTYVNIIYLLLSLPLGLFYCAVIVGGTILGLGLLAILVGIPILLIVLASCWCFAEFERQFTSWMLNVDIDIEASASEGVWNQLKDILSKPAIHRSIIYLFAKLPLGVFSFLVTATLLLLTLSMVMTPITYQVEDFEFRLFQIETPNEALVVAVLGVIVGLVSLHFINFLAAASGRFASRMLGSRPG